VVVFSIHAACLPLASQSFPTRRSSDLGNRSPGPAGATIGGNWRRSSACDGHGSKWWCCSDPTWVDSSPGNRCPRSRRLRALSPRSEEHTSELQSRVDLVCRLLLEKTKK